jgi:L-threonylcarbamoyladenylate synthase
MMRVDPASCRAEDLAAARDWLRAGRIVAYPTDTFYGLAVDPTNAAAVQALFDLKGRDPRVAMPLIAASMEQVRAIAGPLNDASSRLARAAWPGPLSLVLDASPAIAAEVHASRHTIAIRIPAHRVASALADAFGGAITATSANVSGEPPVSSAGALGVVGRDPRVIVVDGGTTPGGAPSTIVDARGDAPVLIRDGAIAWNRVLDWLKR